MEHGPIQRLSYLPPELPPELSGFSEYNAAIVAFRYARRRCSSVPISRWVEMAKWCAGEAVPGLPNRPAEGVTLGLVLTRLEITK
jgi:hypothetical protein